MEPLLGGGTLGQHPADYRAEEDTPDADGDNFKVI